LDLLSAGNTPQLENPMKKYFLLHICLVLFGSLSAQESAPFVSNSLSTKILFIDYGRANDVQGLTMTNGLEIGYIHQFNRFFSIGIPVKLGVADVFEDVNNRTFGSVDALLYLQLQKSEDSKIIPYLLGGAGYAMELRQRANPQFPVGIGMNIRLGDNSYATVQAEYRKSTVEYRNNLQIGVGYIYKFGLVDDDGDGIANKEDRCPDIAGLASAGGCPDEDHDGIGDQEDYCPLVAGSKKFNGCPDTDGDGIADGDDECPKTPGTIRGCPDTDGDGIADRFDECPDEAGAAAVGGCPDRDGDGVPDRQDACPDVAGIRGAGGCPDPVRDQDGDGVPDLEDRCPQVWGVYSGCPDTDGDGLMDADDRCPEVPGIIKNKGCPEMTEQVQEVLDLAMGSVQFESSLATLLKPSYEVLDQLVEIMKQYPDYNMSISGHTDDVGDDAANQLLSEERAKTCYDYLVARGVEPSRLIYQGFGESMPIADNISVVGRLMNRRVEFKMYIP
jgi:outer membrane protein OmpA-like peptidoglycan-associated protein